MLLASLESQSHGPTDVRLRNVSSGGALVEGAEIPPEGSALVFSRNGVHAEAQVVWRAGRLAGLRFEAPIDVDKVLRTIAVPAAAPAPPPQQFHRPGFRVHRLSAMEREWCRLWEGDGRDRANP